MAEFFGAKICRKSEIGEVAEKWGGGCGGEGLDRYRLPDASEERGPGSRNLGGKAARGLTSRSIGSMCETQDLGKSKACVETSCS